MKKAKIYMPTKNAMQSGLVKNDKWIIEFYTKDSGIEPFMGWESSTDTLNEFKLEFSTKELAIEYAKGDKTLITGSFYTVSEAREYFKLEGYSEL